MILVATGSFLGESRHEAQSVGHLAWSNARPAEALVEGMTAFAYIGDAS